MKLKSLAPLALVAGTAACFSAQAQHTISLQGKYINVTCTANFNGTNSASGGLDLPVIAETDFPFVGQTAGDTSFTLALTSCGNNAGTTARAHFWSSGSVSNGRLNLPSSSSGKGWQYQILPAGSTTQLNVVTNSTPVFQSHDSGVDVASGSGTLTYTARYYRSDANLTVGSGKAVLSYAIFYN